MRSCSLRSAFVCPLTGRFNFEPEGNTLTLCRSNLKHMFALPSACFPFQLRRWLTCRVQSRKRDTYRLHRRHAVVIVQSAARAVFARARCAALRAARLRLWMGTFAALYGGDGDIHSASPMATELLQGMNTNPPPPSPPQTPALSQPPALSPQCSAYFATRGGVSGRKKRVGRGRALAEALAPGMGRPPPGCPAAMDVDWGEWGVGFSLVFPPSPGVG